MEILQQLHKLFGSPRNPLITVQRPFQLTDGIGEGLHLTVVDFALEAVPKLLREGVDGLLFAVGLELRATASGQGIAVAAHIRRRLRLKPIFNGQNVN